MADKLYKNANKLRKMGDKVAWETSPRGQVGRGTVKKVKPDGSRVIKTSTNQYVTKKKEDLK